MKNEFIQDYDKLLFLIDFFQQNAFLKSAALFLFLLADIRELVPSITPRTDDRTHDLQQVRQLLQRFALLVLSKLLVQLCVQHGNKLVLQKRFTNAALTVLFNDFWNAIPDQLIIDLWIFR